MASILILTTLLFIACSVGESGGEAENLLSVSRKGNEAMYRDRLNASLAGMTRTANRSEDLQVLLPKLLGNASSQNNVVSVSQVDDQRDAYVAVLIFDAIADDDSVSGYRYDLHVDREAQGHGESPRRSAVGSAGRTGGIVTLVSSRVPNAQTCVRETERTVGVIPRRANR